jgi:hypothetical protein
MSIVSLGEDPRGDFPVWAFRDTKAGNFSLQGWERKSPREVWGWGRDFISNPAKTLSPNMY